MTLAPLAFIAEDDFLYTLLCAEENVVYELVFREHTTQARCIPNAVFQLPTRSSRKDA